MEERVLLQSNCSLYRVTTKEELDSFSCGDEDLNDFFHQEACLKKKAQPGDVTSASWANVTMADGILEALFGLEFGHADFADDADFLLCCLLVPQISRIYTDFF